jgi:hypothetical protein
MPQPPRKSAKKPAPAGWTVASPGRPPYKVGYCRPPKAYQFKPGQSGNPAGRPPGVKRLAALGLADLLAEALGARTTIRIQGRRRKVTKLEAMTRRLADRAAAGDARIVKLLIDQIRAGEARAAEEPEEEFSAADREVIAAMVMRIGGKR